MVTQEKPSWKRRHDVIFIALILASLLLLIALFTYSPNDGAWSVSSSQQTHNAAGMVGALLADILLHLFGYLAYILPVLCIIKLCQLFRKQPDVEGRVWAARGLGLLLSIFTLCVLVDMSVLRESVWLPAGVGGIVGQGLSQVLLPLFGLYGAAVLVVALLALGLMLFLEFSWLYVFERIGRAIIGRLPKKEPAEPSVPTTSSWQHNAKAEGIPILNDAILDAPQYSADDSFAARYAEPVLDDLGFSLSTSEQDDDILPWQEDIPTISEVADRKPQETIQRPETVTKPSIAVKTAAPVAAEPPAQKIVPVEPLEKRDSGISTRVIQEQMGEVSALPPINVLNPPKQSDRGGFSAERLQELSQLLVQKLADFGVKVEVTAVSPGPVITRFEIQPAPGVKASKITNLARDLARSMAMVSVRVVEVIAGKSVMGIEVPNEHRAMVTLSEVLSSADYDNSKSPLTLGLGHDIGGNPVITDLAKMPHLLVAGTTGSGKSVGVNAMLLSLLFKSTPEELRLILVDPKMLELSVYEGIPHLLTPVVTDMKEASNALRWSVAEMERRYMLMAAMGVRNIAGYNKKVKDAIAAGEPLTDPLWRIEQSFHTQPPLLEPLPYIVIVIDEFADMMMMVGKKVEELIARIAQKARAAGIHMILATQRPSVDVITGLIKANIPTRMAFQVSSKIDSRTILDQGGAEQLLGHGDMLYMPPGLALPERVHGAFVDDDEVHRVVAEWKKRGAPNYIEEILSHDEEGGASASGEGGGEGGEQDELYDLAVAFVLESGKCSISSVQRKLRVGYNRAANIVEAMEYAGVVSKPAHNGSREVLVGSSSEY